jgi:hypothetical protein
MLKTALLVGCGSKWGASFTENLADNGYQIDLITGSNFSYPNVNTIKIDWFGLNVPKIKELLSNSKKYDLIFFNQNSGGAPNDHYLKPYNDLDLDQWNFHNWINCQLPYVIIKHLTPSIGSSTKIGWMMTGLIAGHDVDKFQYAGYACVKSSNLHIMRGFSQFHPGIFFAINPIWFPIEDYKKDAGQILNIIERLEIKDTGKSFMKDGSDWL